MKKVFILLLFTLYNMAGAQLAAFTVTATKINDETCPSNGAISWTTTGTTAGGTMTYNIVNESTNAVVASTSSTSFSGLIAGSYKIVATQTVGSESNQATSNIINILNQKVAINYTTQVINEICGSDGKITVNVFSGKPTYTYQLLDSSLNVVLSQTTNVFSGLVAGTYYVRVIDQCGAGVAQKAIVNYTPSNFTINTPGSSYPLFLDSGCVINYLLSLNILNSNTIKLPLKLDISYSDSSGNPQTLTTNITTDAGSSCYSTSCNYSYSPPIKIPFDSTLTTMPTTIKVTDACGFSQSINYTFNLNLSISEILYASSCGGQYVQFDFYNIKPYQYKVNFTSAPAGFNPIDYNANHNTMQSYHIYGSATQPLPAGSYSVEIIDSCGRIATKTFTVTNTSPTINSYIGIACPSGSNTNVRISSGFYFTSAQMVSAPAGYTGPLPYDIPITSFYKNSSTDPGYTGFVLSNLPPGTYSFSYKTTCDANTVYSGSAFISNSTYTANSTIDIAISCNSAKINYTMSSSSPGAQQYIGIQKYYPDTGHWAFLTNDIATYPSEYRYISQLDYYYGTTYSSSKDLNNLTPGRYRVLYYYYPYTVINNELLYNYCVKNIKEFTIGDDITFTDAYAFQCADGAYDVAISASKGAETLSYSIVSDESSSATTILNNGTNPIFHGLEGGSYYLRVADACGNFVTRKLDLATLGKPVVSVVPDCTTGSIKLVVNGVDYLRFAWTKTKNADGTPTNDLTVLSTTNVLDLGVYDAADAGTYTVHMYSDPTLGYCINSSQDMSLTVDALTAASAGTGQTVTITYDPTMTQLNLFDYLTPPYDGYGTWTEVSGPSSNLLVNQYWNVGIASRGTYNFLYTVTSPCTGAVSTANVIINLLKTCYNTVTNINPGIPVNHGITLLKRAGTDNKFGGSAWPLNRSSAHTVLESNTKGFVITRVPTSGLSAITTPVEGMMVYDTTAKCLKIYVVDNNNSANSGWKCFSTPSCP